MGGRDAPVMFVMQVLRWQEDVSCCHVRFIGYPFPSRPLPTWCAVVVGHCPTAARGHPRCPRGAPLSYCQAVIAGHHQEMPIRGAYGMGNGYPHGAPEGSTAIPPIHRSPWIRIRWSHGRDRFTATMDQCAHTLRTCGWGFLARHRFQRVHHRDRTVTTALHLRTDTAPIHGR